MHEEIKKLNPEEADRVLELPNSYRDAGRVEGREVGREEGIVIGIEKGVERGMKKGIEKMVFNMLEKGMSEEEIAEIADLSVNEIKKMRKKI